MFQVSHPSEQILDKFVPFNLEAPSSTDTSSTIQTLQGEVNGLHERLYQAATNISCKKKKSRI